MNTFKDTLSATLMITGCCLGAGMLGLPVVTALAGFIPSTLAMLLCYLFATSTGLLMLEATLWFDEKANLISMAHFALGKAGKVLTWLLFLFLFYSLFVAYIAGGGMLFTATLSSLLSVPLPREVGILCCVAFVGAVVYCGTHAVSLTSRLFLLGAVVCYCALLSLGLTRLNTENLSYTNWNSALSTIPILLVCFGYQNLIPTLTQYVKRNVKALRIAIFLGNLIPFVIYFLWNLVILGILPENDPTALNTKASQAEMVTGLLEGISNSGSVLLFVNVFSFLTILTPFMTNTITFVHFLEDGFSLKKKSKYDLLVHGCVLIPPTLFTLFYPHLFLQALKIAGGFADVLLLGILPTTIVWTGRYIKKVEGSYTVAGGKPFLVVIFLLCLFFLSVRG